jgi:hypothetical protein
MANIFEALFGGGQSSNPFQSAAQSDPWQGMRAPTPAAEMSPMQAPAQATSRQPAGRPYSPMLASDGPLARAGWIGSLLAQGPSREEHMLQQAGSATQSAVTSIGQRIQGGMAPQRAILDFASSPEGQQFFVSGGGFSDLANIAKGMGTDITSATRQKVFGEIRQAEQAAPGAVAGQDAQVAAVGGAGDPVAQEAKAAFSDAVSPDKYLRAAEVLASQGDDEGSKLALQMAEEARQYQALAVPPTTDELKEYDRAVAQAKAAGTTPPSWVEYKTTINKSSASQTNINTATGLDTETMKARLDVDKDAAKEAGKVALKAQQAIPALEEIERLSDKVSGGYKGVLTPYLARVAETFGMDIPAQWSDAETLNALSQQLLPLVRQPGAVSDYEQRAYTAAIPALQQTPEGRIKMVKVLKRQAERAMQIAKVYRQNLGKDDLYERLAELDTPMFKPDEIAEFTKLAGVKDATGAAQTPAGPEIGTVEMDDEGNPFVFSGGDPADPNSWKPQGEPAKKPSGRRQGGL